jgi:hypothetical protein
LHCNNNFVFCNQTLTLKNLPMPTTTNIDVRVIAKGGKYLGDDVGGALVTIYNAQTGDIVASGNTSGGSGSPDLMTETIGRIGTWDATDASVFSAAIELDEPMLLKVTAWGPKGGLQSANTVSATQWMIPGIDITGGDGLLLEIPGLQVQAMQPATHTNFAGVSNPTVDFLANVTMMCGCPITTAGPWVPEMFTVAVLIQEVNGAIIDTVPLTFTGTTSQFSGSYTLPAGDGNYVGIMYATQPDNGNSGMARVSFFVPPAASTMP